MSSRSVKKHPVTGDEMWTSTRAARYLGISRSSLLRRLDPEDPAYDAELARASYQEHVGSWRWIPVPHLRALRERTWTKVEKAPETPSVPM